MDVEKPVCRLNASSLTGAAAGGGGLTGAAAGGGSQQSQPPQDLCTGDGHCGGEEDGDCDGERGGEEKSARETGAKRRRGKDERAVEKVRKYTDIQHCTKGRVPCNFCSPDTLPSSLFTIFFAYSKTKEERAWERD